MRLYSIYFSLTLLFFAAWTAAHRPVNYLGEGIRAAQNRGLLSTKMPGAANMRSPLSARADFQDLQNLEQTLVHRSAQQRGGISMNRDRDGFARAKNAGGHIATGIVVRNKGTVQVGNVSHASEEKKVEMRGRLEERQPKLNVKLQNGKRRLVSDSQVRAEFLVGAGVNGSSAIVTISKSEKPKTAVAEEEEKLRKATMKLVFWSRNRLRKRLEEIVALDNNIVTENSVLENLDESIAETANERTREIQRKRENKKELDTVRKDLNEPEQELLVAQKQNKKLSDQLAQLVDTYDNLALKQRKLEANVRSAGFSHWLETQGKEYLPSTAIGVLAKSTEILVPVSRRLERVVVADQKLATRVEGFIPKLSEKSLPGKVIGDLLMLLPVLPFLILFCRLQETANTFSVVHIVLYLATVFAAQSFVLLFVSACLGAEALRAFQAFSNRVFALWVFMNAASYAIYLFTHVLIAVLRPCREEILQTGITAGIGIHYYLTVFRHAVLDRNISVTVLSHLACLIHFLLVAIDKKRRLGIHLSYEDEVNRFWGCLQYWVVDTMDAMKIMFSDGSTETFVSSKPEITPRPRIVLKKAYSEESDSEDLDNQAEKSLPPPVSQMRGAYGRWSGARILRSARQQHTSNSTSAGQVNSKLTGSGSRFRRAAMQSTSNCSTSFFSCRGSDQ